MSHHTRPTQAAGKMRAHPEETARTADHILQGGPIMGMNGPLGVNGSRLYTRDGQDKPSPLLNATLSSSVPKVLGHNPYNKTAKLG